MQVKAGKKKTRIDQKCGFNAVEFAPKIANLEKN